MTGDSGMTWTSQLFLSRQKLLTEVGDIKALVRVFAPQRGLGHTNHLHGTPAGFPRLSCGLSDSRHNREGKAVQRFRLRYMSPSRS
jgi:hypothetical protein